MALIDWLSYNVANSLPQYVEFQSRKDLSYDRRFNPKVNCQAFYGEVCNRLSCEGDVSPITVSFPFPGGTPGQRIITPMHTLRTLRDDYGADINSVAAAKKAAGGDWLKQWTRLERNPAGECAKESMTFDDLIGWARAYFILTPVTHEQYAAALHERLGNQGVRVCPPDKVKTLGHAGFMACGCKTFLHYAWCEHACEDACRKGLIVFSDDCWPAELNPVRFGDAHEFTQHKRKKAGK